ncbi:MAG: hypothetical protein AAB198_01785 [Actinomycetota bacterium]
MALISLLLRPLLVADVRIVERWTTSGTLLALATLIVICLVVGLLVGRRR